MKSEVLAVQVESVARGAGLVVVSSATGVDFSGGATTQFRLGFSGDITGDSAKTHLLEVTGGFECGRPDLMAGMKVYLAGVAQRLRNPRPECFLTLSGLPLSFGRFAWPFHGSTSGADTFLVHGEVRLEDGNSSPLHAKISASMTVTFKEIVAAMEQPYAEGIIYNAVRKTMDQGQLELVKSGNRQPVPVTTRYYSMREKKFVFNDTTVQQQQEYMAAKVFWLGGVLGKGQAVWLLDPLDAQYLDTTVAELRRCAEALAAEGLIGLGANWSASGDTIGGEFGTPTQKLMERKQSYDELMAEALAFIRPTFNEDMRGGHTNM